MNVQLQELVRRLNRKTADILFGEHAAKDKNLAVDDVENVLLTVRRGKIDEEKSAAETQRVCFKNYSKEIRETYFVVTEYYPDFIKIVTVIKKKGKY